MALGASKNGPVIARALTIAGSDSSGGAGIQADLKTFTVHGVYGMSAITALTAQNTGGVTAVHVAPAAFVHQQLVSVLSDIGCDAAKTGMLATREIVAVVVSAIRESRVAKLVVDPVMVAQSGAALLDRDAVQAIRDELLPLALLVTPNIPEAEALTGIRIDGVAAMHEAAAMLLRQGAQACLIKGGHLAGSQAVDVLHLGSETLELTTPRIPTRHTHGTGCQLSAAITANLALGYDLRSAVESGKRFITKAIAAGLDIGHGDGPANPLAWLPAQTRDGFVQIPRLSAAAQDVTPPPARPRP